MTAKPSQEDSTKAKEKRKLTNPLLLLKDDGTKKNAKSKREQSNDKLPAGLALMHGFNARNVGKQRLTVRIRLVDTIDSHRFSI